jgi:hypothetical protein
MFGHAGRDEGISDDVLLRLSGSVFYIEKSAMIISRENHQATDACPRTDDFFRSAFFFGITQ